MAVAKTVFLSHTSEFARYPEGRSFVDAAMNAINTAGCLATDMRNFPAADRDPAAVCVERVRKHDVYVGLIGFRYGSQVGDRPEVSYTELEFEAATAGGLSRLIFMLAEDADVRPAFVLDVEYAKRQEAFRNRLTGSGVVVKYFRSLAELEAQVEKALRELLAAPSPGEPGGLAVSWTAHDDGLPHCEFIYFIPGGLHTACELALRNTGPETARVRRIELRARIFRQFMEGGDVLGTEMLEECPLQFAAGESDEETGLAWQGGGVNRWVIDTPFTVPGNAEIVLPSLDLGFAEDDPSALAEVRDLIAVATLGVEYSITVVADQPSTHTTLSGPLRVLGSLEEEGDGGIKILVERLRAKDEEERQRLRQEYDRARKVDWQLRGIIAERLNQIEQRKSIERAEQAAMRRPRDSDARCQLRLVLLSAARAEDALAELDRAVELGRNSAEVRLGRSEAFRNLSRLEEALVEADLALAAGGEDVRAQEQRGRILIDLERYEEARAAFDAALRLAPDSASGHFGRGLTLWLMESNDEALAAFDRAVSIDPDTAEAHVARASVLASLERDLDAVAAVRKALLCGFKDLEQLRRIENLLGDVGRTELRALLKSLELLEAYDQLPMDSGGDPQPSAPQKSP